VPRPFQASAETPPRPGPATGTTWPVAICAITTSPSANPAATISCCGWQATAVHSTPSPPASSVGALPIGPPPKKGQSTTLSAPLLASHRPFAVKESERVFEG
jgi:hypothetical protein